MALLAVVATLVAPGGPATACATSACNERVARRDCFHGEVYACVERGALRWRVSPAMLMRKARCESRMNPRAVNASSGAAGLFQFMPSTWASTPYRRRSIFSAEYSALAAAWMHAAGRGGEWACR